MQHHCNFCAGGCSEATQCNCGIVWMDLKSFLLLSRWWCPISQVYTQRSETLLLPDSPSPIPSTPFTPSTHTHITYNDDKSDKLCVSLFSSFPSYDIPFLWGTHHDLKPSYILISPTSTPFTPPPPTHTNMTYNDDKSNKLCVSLFSSFPSYDIPFLWGTHNDLSGIYLVFSQLMVTGQLGHCDAIGVQPL